ncbi:MAG TPA: hypothetical protein PLZ08_09020 [Bacillota bacterium]|jgi:hypothetical protein|nr:hypothetical protein [Bacillota bacterium]HPO98078.1 hypothetical protein [Bacillota bacterium]
MKKKLLKLTSAERIQFKKDFAEFRKREAEIRGWIKNGAGKEIVNKHKEDCLKEIVKIQNKKMPIQY